LKRSLNLRFEEINAYSERNKTLQPNTSTSINMEYLKNCIFRFMISTEHSERIRLYPVVATILKFTPSETSMISSALETRVDFSPDSTLSTLSTFFGSFQQSQSNPSTPISPTSKR
jgi:hypothetical protein